MEETVVKKVEESVVDLKILEPVVQKVKDVLPDELEARLAALEASLVKAVDVVLPKDGGWSCGLFGLTFSVKKSK
jgi:hypothetical protein